MRYSNSPLAETWTLAISASKRVPSAVPLKWARNFLWHNCRCASGVPVGSLRPRPLTEVTPFLTCRMRAEKASSSTLRRSPSYSPAPSHIQRSHSPRFPLAISIPSLKGAAPAARDATGHGPAITDHFPRRRLSRARRTPLAPPPAGRREGGTCRRPGPPSPTPRSQDPRWTAGPEPGAAQASNLAPTSSASGKSRPPSGAAYPSNMHSIHF